MAKMITNHSCNDHKNWYYWSPNDICL